MQFVMQLSFSDFSQVWGVSERTWGESAVRSLIDSVYDTGIRTLFWRTPGFPSRGKYSEIRYFSKDEIAKLVGRELSKRELDILTPFFEGEGLTIDFTWHTLKMAIDYAHSKGMTIWSWYDQADSHGGCGNWGGLFVRKHSKFILQHPDLTRKSRRGGLYNQIEVEEHKDPNCPLKGRGQHGSLCFKEVQDHRLSVIQEVVEYGMDGVYIVDYGYIGYEDPVVNSFKEKYGLDPNELPEDDSRWVSHQGGVLTGYLRRVRDLLNSSGRDIGLAFESRGPRKSLPGLRLYLTSQIETLINEKVLDYVSVWVGEDVLTLKKIMGGDASHVIRRFELSSDAEKWWLFEGASAMKDLGIAIFSVDEATNVEPDHWELIGEMVDTYGD